MSVESKSFIDRFCRFVRHVRNGTLLERLRFGWESRKKERHAKRWHQGMSRFGYVDCRINDKAKLRLYADSVLSGQIFFRDFEKKERMFVRRYLRSGDVFIDVGANIGLFTVEAAMMVGKSGRVYAFEPNPRTFERLEENISLNRLENVSALQAAVAVVAGRVLLTVSTDGYDAWSSLGKPIAGESFEAVEVSAVTLDSFIDSHDLKGRIVMIKIDVEGWECAVLRGGSSCLSAPDAPLLQVEFTREAAVNAYSSCEELFLMIKNFGYELYSYDAESNLLHLVENNLDWDYENLFATKNLDQVYRRLTGV